MDTKFRLRDWTRLSDLALDLILQKYVASVSDFLCFSLVCKPWYSFVSNNSKNLLQHFDSSSIQGLPLLMLFQDRIRASTVFNASLYSVTKCKMISDFILSRHWAQTCCGSFHGWLAFLHCTNILFSKDDYATIIIRLFNPFSGEIIKLPRLKSNVRKIIISKNPSTSPHNFEVTAMLFKKRWKRGKLGEPLAVLKSCCQTLAVLKSGCRTWSLTCPEVDICDMVYHDEKLYVVSNGGMVSSMDNATLKFELVAEPPPILDTCFGKWYLVKTITNELIRVEISNRYNKPRSVKISKLVACSTTGKSMFVNVDNLGDESLFLSDNGAMSVLASKFPGCESNSLYYMDMDSSEESLHYCADIIHLQDGSVNTLSSEMPISNYMRRRHALWIFPTPKLKAFREEEEGEEEEEEEEDNEEEDKEEEDEEEEDNEEEDEKEEDGEEEDEEEESE